MNRGAFSRFASISPTISVFGGSSKSRSRYNVADKITDNIYLGDFLSPNNDKFLKAERITHVLTVAAELASPLDNAVKLHSYHVLGKFNRVESRN